MKEGTSSGPCPDRICLPSPAQALSFEVVVKSRGLPVVIGERNRVAAQREVKGWSCSFLDQKGW